MKEIGLLFMITSSSVYAGDVEKAFKNLKEYCEANEKEKAKQAFFGLLQAAVHARKNVQKVEVQQTIARKNDPLCKDSRYTAKYEDYPKEKMNK